MTIFHVIGFALVAWLASRLLEGERKDVGLQFGRQEAPRRNHFMQA